jgi:DNA-binding NtrC family response regulator
MALVLVVDDVAALAEQYAYDLKRVGGYETRTASGGREALDVIAWNPVDCVILDLEMPGVDGFGVLRELGEQALDIPVIVYTGTGSYDRCVQAIKLGAYSFIDKDEPMERVAREVENALERSRLAAEVETLRRESAADTPLVGSSRAMKALGELIARVGPVPSPVLVTGESGTGKELVARELHRLGPAPDGAFVAVNCAALPENLVESELFGHEKGAFTGATRTRRGAFEQASGGTLFLDEIGELPPPAQAKLLRVLEARVITRVGGESEIDVDARVVAATNRDLEAEVAAGHFREDLYYRLNVHIVRVPALRERCGDVPELTGHFLTTQCMRLGVRARRIDPAAMAALKKYDWARNNVRELRNIVERMIIAADGDVIGLEHVPAEIREPASADPPRTFKELRAQAERRIIREALERNDWHISHTAADLGLADHASLLKVMRRLDIRRS